MDNEGLSFNVLLRYNGHSVGDYFYNIPIFRITPLPLPVPLPQQVVPLHQRAVPELS